MNKTGVLLAKKKEGTAVRPAIKKVCHTREGEHLEQEDKGRTQNSMDVWHSHREEISNAKEIGGEKSQRRALREAQEEFQEGVSTGVHVAEL